MALPPENSEHAEAVARFVQRWRDKPKLEALARSYLDRIQDVEDALNEIIAVNIDTALGVQLDKLGVIVKQVRTTSDDEIYRSLIRARIAINRSDGTPESILTVARLLLIDAEDFELTEEPPAQLRLTIKVPLTSIDGPLMQRLLSEADAAGVRLLLSQPTTATAADVFTFAGPGTGAGFGYSFDPALGGKYSTVIDSNYAQIVTPPPPPWAPDPLDPDLILWVEARNGGPLVSGATPAVEGETVYQWSDLSAVAAHATQPTGASRATFREDAFGAGIPGVEHSTAAHRFVNACDTVTATGITTIFAFNQTTPDGAAYHTDFDGAGGVRLVVMPRYYSGGAPAPIGYLGGGADVNSGVSAVAGTQVETFRGGGGVGEQWRNGVLIHAGAYADSRVVGGHFPSSLGGGIITYGAILVYRASITDTKRLKAEAYLAGLVGL